MAGNTHPSKSPPCKTPPELFLDVKEQPGHEECSSGWNEADSATAKGRGWVQGYGCRDVRVYMCMYLGSEWKGPENLLLLGKAAGYWAGCGGAPQDITKAPIMVEVPCRLYRNVDVGNFYSYLPLSTCPSIQQKKSYSLVPLLKGILVINAPIVRKL